MSGTVDVGVVVPTFRRPDRALRLVDALEAQTLDRGRFAVVLVDDCSGDGSFELLEKRAGESTIDIRVARTPRNQGPAGARNLGASLLDAPVLAFTDDDCVPEPGWLAAGLAVLERWPEVGVVQGRTDPPPGFTTGDWTLWRQVHRSTPWFEACNVFYRRAPLLAAGGFAEELGYYGEDAAAGWRVVDQGWKREYADDAVVRHDVEERGVGWHLRYGVLERNIVWLAARHPELRRTGFWRPWAFRPENAALALAAAGLLAGLRWRPALAAALPYAYLRRPVRGHPRRWRFLAEQVAVDAAQTYGHLQGSVRNRVVVL